MMLTFGSVCSGIEAASVAWEPLGWKAAWFAEVDKAASAVLAHRFPGVPNHGDMTLLAGMVRRREIPAPDVLVGGTPCQAFSVAGLRGGLSDERGQLTLAFVLLAHAIDEVRREDGLPPVIVVWENVPGVLNHKDNPLGCFLAGLAGEDLPLEPPGGRWTNAGHVCGPERSIAWRTLDAQFFGLAQRRRRVFVVASAREGFDPAAILLEFDGVRRDSAPSREAGEGITHPTSPCLVSSGRGVERTGDTRGQDPVVDDSDDGRIRHAADRVTATLDASYGRLQGCSGQDANHGHSHLILTRRAPLPMAHGQGGAEIRVDQSPTLTCNHEAPIAFTAKDYGGVATVNMSPTLRSMGHSGSHANGGGQVAVLAFDTTQVTSPSNYSSPREGDPCHPLAAGAHPPAVCVTGTVTHTLRAEGFDASEDGTGRGQPIVAIDIRNAKIDAEGPTMALQAGGMGEGRGLCINAIPHTVTEMAVRRLMPVECERLQGFPDNWTLVPTGPKGKLAADGPRYKQCGNSMATHCMNWIGRRIAAHLGSNGGPALDDFDALLA